MARLLKKKKVKEKSDEVEDEEEDEEDEEDEVKDEVKKKPQEQPTHQVFIPRAVSNEEMFNTIADRLVKIELELTKLTKELQKKR